MDVGSAVERIKARKKKYREAVVGLLVILGLSIAGYKIYPQVMVSAYHYAALHTTDNFKSAELETRSQMYADPKGTMKGMKTFATFEGLSNVTYQKDWCAKYLTLSIDGNPQSIFVDDIRRGRMACQYILGNHREAMDEAKIIAEDTSSRIGKKIEFSPTGRSVYVRFEPYASLILWAANGGRYELADDLIKEFGDYRSKNGMSLKDTFSARGLVNNGADHTQNQQKLCKSDVAKKYGGLAYLCYRDGFISRTSLPEATAIRKNLSTSKA